MTLRELAYAHAHTARKSRDADRQAALSNVQTLLKLNVHVINDKWAPACGILHVIR